jgi:hypothetical protein
MAMMAVVMLALLDGAVGFEFLSIGDWGDPAAKELNPWMGKENPEFVIAIGAIHTAPAAARRAHHLSSPQQPQGHAAFARRGGAL